MKKKIVTLLGMTVLACTLAVGCGSSGSQPSETAETEETVPEETADTAEDTAPEETAEAAEEMESEAPEVSLEDGVYTAEFDTDSGMFHVSEACDGKGTLTVQDGAMTIHVSLASKNIVNLYPGLAEDAQKEGAEVLEPTTDSVTYSDGITEEVYGFDIPVPALDEEFDLALLGTKGTWYDHKVIVSNPEPAEEAVSE
ncbi:hypothetical protein B5F29_02980 [Lachnoclostridium sp. An196]|uniref:hypothetical protein n=1 Tax=Lachnoclostridium sp. An196 TaxID=1965583 RepID=UPI000B37247B|nr:hypothetical protein [Lachnoclostridium sp. An196]OUP21463.1 hypothetical protein B5F29_02980 [Lachnoclostridium sp. An196]